MNTHFGSPGVGGSLGICALCGEDFLHQILTGEKVKTLESSSVKQTLYAHKACVKQYLQSGEPSKHLDVLSLPDKSPLRLAYESKGGRTTVPTP